MPCCGGGSGMYRPPTPPAVTGVAQPQTPGTKYVVTTPQGVVHEYWDEKWRADQVLAMRGGSLETITPDQQGNAS